jgi:MarC family membrane protein
MDVSFASAVVILLLVTDPIGNIPLFASLLRNVDPKRRMRIVVRECAIAYAVLLGFVVFGQSILDLLGLSDRSLNIAGGVILFLIALRMIFRTPEGIFGDAPAGEPFIVPLAIPSIAGPTAIATVVLLVSRAPGRWPEWLVAVTAAMIVTLAVLLFAERIGRWMGERGIAALERLMGLLLTAVAVEMLLRGIEGFVLYLQGG